MVRKLANTLLSLLLVLPTTVFALGMGDIRLQSALNQPFKAEIELLSVSAEEAESLKVGLASYESFARVGLERPATLMFLRFEVQQQNGRHVVRVTSTEPVRDPFLSFLVEVSWSSGRLVREYTVLIDPPGMGISEPPRVEAPVVAAPAPAWREEPAVVAAPAPVSEPVYEPVTAAPAEPAAPALYGQDSERLEQEAETFEPTPVAPAPAPAPVARAPEPAPAPVGAMTYGPVKANETLWAIASRMRPDRSVSIQQMMMALLKANPEAFYGNNINRLKKGYVLRLDDPSLITAMSKAEALRAVSVQNRAWQDHVQQTAAAAGERRAAATEGDAGRAVAAPAEAQLKLVAPDGEGKATAGTAANAADAETLRKQLLLAEESSEAQRRENAELRSRVQELEGQVQSMQRLLALKDSDLAALQQQMGAVPAVPEETAAAPAAEAAVDKPEAVAEEAVDEPGVVAEEAEAAAATPAPAAAPRPVRPTPPAPVEEPGLLDQILGYLPPMPDVAGNPMLLGGLGVVVLALLALLMIRRRRAAGGANESILTAGGTSMLNSQTAAGLPSEESSLFSDLAVSGMNSVQGGDAEVDPLTEADVYMAYGRHQQAEELLTETLKTQPERQDIKVKLLEVYYANKDRAAFEPLAAEVSTALEGNGPLWNKVLAMGHELCPDNPMFGAAPEGVAAMGLAAPAAAGDVLDIGIDLDALGEDSSGHSEAAGDFNLDLGVDFADLEGAAPAAMASEAEPATEASELADMEFDLSGFGEATTAPEEEFTSELVAEAEAETPAPSLDFELGDLSFGEDEEVAAAAAPIGEEEPVAGGSLDFELGDLSFEPEPESGAAVTAAELPRVEEQAELDVLDDLELGDIDAVGTKLDLAKAYVDMGEPDSARSILEEVLNEGDNNQRQQAQELLGQLA